MHLRTSFNDVLAIRKNLREDISNGKTAWAAGAFDALSAKLIEEAGFQAVFTSGLCVSCAQFGLPDTELYTMTENLDVIRRVVSAVNIPAIVDGDTGYGNAINVMRTVREFEAAGAAGIVFEDQLSPKQCPAVAESIPLLSIEEFSGKIRAAVQARTDPSMLLIARTDAMDPEEAILRAKAYVAAGADLIQPISRTFHDVSGLRALHHACGVPLSLQLVGWMESGLSKQEIEEIGGLAIYTVVPLMTAVQAMRDNLASLANTQSASDLPHSQASHVELSNFLGFHEVIEMQKRFLTSAT